MNYEKMTKAELIKEIQKQKINGNRKKENITTKHREYLLTILNSINHPFYVINVDNYKIELANHALSGGSELNESYCYRVACGRDKPCNTADHRCPLNAVKTTKKSVVVEHIHVNENGESRNIEVHAYPIFRDDGAVKSIIEYLVDVTDQKKAELKIKQTLKKLEISNKELERYAYVASHDLREPLRMISIYTELLHEKYKVQYSDQEKKYLHYILDGTKRMNSLINDLLLYSRIVGTDSKPEPIDAFSVINCVLKNLEFSIKKTGSQVILGNLPVINFDRTQFIQLIQNLISNAIKYRSDKTPEIKIDARRDGDRWLFSIKDNGVGIDMEYSNRIFEVFQQLHEKCKYSGSGIGLSITKKIVEQHGGSIWVESEAGMGSTFFFTIPDKGK